MWRARPATSSRVYWEAGARASRSVRMGNARCECSVSFKVSGDVSTNFFQLFHVSDPSAPIGNGTVEVFAAAGWQPIRALSAPPGPRRGHSAVVHVSRDGRRQLVVYGGRGSERRLSVTAEVAAAGEGVVYVSINGSTACPNDCFSGNQSVRGICVSGKCNCFDGYSGDDCVRGIRYFLQRRCIL
eukprot:374232_1